MKLVFELLTNLEKAADYFSDSDGIITLKTESDDSGKIVVTRIAYEPGNVYGIYENKELVYIGERQEGKIHERLNQHFVSCSSSTSSKLGEVNNALKNNKDSIGYKVLQVIPDYERYSVETFLIKKFRPKWNKRDNHISIELSSPDESFAVDNCSADKTN